MKTCYRCYEDKPTKEMQVRKGKVLGVCKGCYEKHYANLCKSEKELRKTKREADKRSRNRRRQFVLNHLKRNPCTDCGENDIIVLEFDHLNPKEKFKEVAKIVANGTTKQLKEEVAKCEVVCANCHRKRTANMFGSWRLD